MSSTIKEWFAKKVLDWQGLVGTNLPASEDRLTFVCNMDEIVRTKLHEYNIWYEGDSDELLNFYTAANTITYNFEPWYDRNKKNYFWAINSTENDIKRTHSGQPRNIVDTLCGIIDWPLVKANPLGSKDNIVDDKLQYILKRNNFRKLYKDRQLPLSLIEGWGCYKIDIDKDFLDVPVVKYYQATNVEFAFRHGLLTGIMFEDYYVNKNKTYLLAEIRRFVVRDQKRYLVIENHLFEVSTGASQYVTEVNLDTVPETKGMAEELMNSAYE